MDGRWKIDNQRFRAAVQESKNLVDTERHMADEGPAGSCPAHTFTENGMRKAIFSRMKRREKGPSWNSCSLNEEEKLEAVRVFVDGGVSNHDDCSVKC